MKKIMNKKITMASVALLSLTLLRCWGAKNKAEGNAPKENNKQVEAANDAVNQAKINKMILKQSTDRCRCF